MILKTNEPNWKINLVREATSYLDQNKNNLINKLEAENSLRVGEKVLFPDMLLFGKNNQILQGWELKFPDTHIDDKNFIENAQKKAEALKLNSFLLWNFSVAKLYKKVNNVWEVIKIWNDLEVIKKREEVKNNLSSSYDMLKKILVDLEYFFLGGDLKGNTICDIISSDEMMEYIIGDTSELKKDLEKGIQKDTKFEDEVTAWWNIEKNNTLSKDKFIVLSEYVYISVLNKIIFANILKKYFPTIKNTLEKLEEKKLDTFSEISSTHNFYNIFSAQLGEEYIGENIWKNLIEFNNFIMKLTLGDISENLITDILENIVMRSKRKIAGQFTTPKWLAELLTFMTLKNKSGNTIDPCCGTGTISKAILDVKKDCGMEVSEVFDSTWSFDKFRYPLQLAMLSLTDPKIIINSQKVCLKDVFDIKIGEEIELKEPRTGQIIKTKIPKFDSICSNLPFIQQGLFKKLNPNAINETEEILRKNLKIRASGLSGRGDLYTYIPFKLWEIINEEGRVGIIVSNSWLGTSSGIIFYSLLLRFYKILYVMTSGKERWFKNADIVTNIIILEKREKVVQDQKDIIKEQIKFVTLFIDRPFELHIKEIKVLTSFIRRGEADERYNINEYSIEDINIFYGKGINKNALFFNCQWLKSFFKVLIPLNKKFRIFRGERRGWDQLFYPINHEIESKYLKPLIKNSRNIDYIAEPDSEAFCTLEAEYNLDRGAKEWISKFKNKVNEVGKPLTEVLKKDNLDWYQMKNSSLADIVISVNLDQRIFFSKCISKSFINQRLIGLEVINDNEDIDLQIALLNSTLGLFLVEAIGFPRGLGALDLNSTKFNNNYHMIKSELLKPEEKEKIKKLYNKIEKRRVEKIQIELEMEDRQEFDLYLLKCLGLDSHYNDLKTTFISLVEMRKQKNNKK